MPDEVITGRARYGGGARALPPFSFQHVGLFSLGAM
jgi:hypothetical protein